MNRKTIFILNLSSDQTLLVSLQKNLALDTFSLDTDFPLEAHKNLLAPQEEEKFVDALLDKYLAFSKNELAIVLAYKAPSTSLDINKKISEILCSHVIAIVDDNSELGEIALRFGKKFLGYISKGELASEVKFLGSVDSIDVPHIREEISKEDYLVPEIFRHNLFVKATEKCKKICLPESLEPRILTAAKFCEEQKIAKCILIGDRAEIFAAAKGFGIDLPETITIIPHVIRDSHVARLVELRKAKGMDENKAKLALEEAIMFATMLLEEGEVDGIVAGVLMTTAKTITPAFQIIKTKPGAKLVSGVFIMCMSDKVLIFGDCAVNPSPDPQALADIAIQSSETAKAFGLTPRVAMLSFSTMNSASGPEVDKVKEAVRLSHEKDPTLAVDGPLQYDASIDLKTGKQKAPTSLVAGQANVFIFPSLEAGNIGYKIAQRTDERVIAIGPILQGLNKPVNDLSRGALVEDVIYTIAITCIQA